MWRWAFLVVRPQLSSPNPNFSGPRTRTTKSDSWSLLTHQLLGRLKFTIPNLQIYSPKKANSEKLGLGIDNPRKIVFSSLRMKKCSERVVNDRHFWNPGVFSYAMIPRWRPNLNVFFFFFIVTSVVYDQNRHLTFSHGVMDFKILLINVLRRKVNINGDNTNPTHDVENYNAFTGNTRSAIHKQKTSKPLSTSTGHRIHEVITVNNDANKRLVINITRSSLISNFRCTFVQQITILK